MRGKKKSEKYFKNGVFAATTVVCIVILVLYCVQFIRNTIVEEENFVEIPSIPQHCTPLLYICSCLYMCCSKKKLLLLLGVELLSRGFQSDWTLRPMIWNQFSCYHRCYAGCWQLAGTHVIVVNSMFAFWFYSTIWMTITWNCFLFKTNYCFYNYYWNKYSRLYCCWLLPRPRPRPLARLCTTCSRSCNSLCKFACALISHFSSSVKFGGAACCYNKDKSKVCLL
jgi:hypothetical protein